MSKLCESYKAMLKHALVNTRKVFENEHNYDPEDTAPLHPSEEELEIEQGELF